MGEGCREGVKKREAPIVRMVRAHASRETDPAFNSPVV